MERKLVRRIGIIGLGKMGTPMARRLLQGGHRLTVFDICKTPMEALWKEGALQVATPKELADGSDVILLSLPNGEAVSKALFGENGAIHGMKEGGVVIDTSTIGPASAREIASVAQEKGVHILDAPVSGGPEGASTGTLAFMVGGDRQIYEEYMDVFKILGQHIFYMGGPGTGQSTKLVNQILVGANVVATCEALLFGASQGLDLQRVADVIKASAGDSFMFRRASPQIIAQSFGSGFATYLVHKDLELALNEASKKRIPLLLCGISRELLSASLGLGNEKVDVASLIGVLNKLSVRLDHG